MTLALAPMTDCATRLAGLALAEPCGLCAWSAEGKVLVLRGLA